MIDNDHNPRCGWATTQNPPWGSAHCYECTLIAVQAAQKPWWQALVKSLRHAVRR